MLQCYGEMYIYHRVGVRINRSHSEKHEKSLWGALKMTIVFHIIIQLLGIYSRKDNNEKNTRDIIFISEMFITVKFWWFDGAEIAQGYGCSTGLYFILLHCMNPWSPTTSWNSRDLRALPGGALVAPKSSPGGPQNCKLEAVYLWALALNRQAYLEHNHEKHSGTLSTAWKGPSKSI